MIKKTNFNPEPLIEHMKSVPYELVHTALYDGAALYDGFRPEQPESEQDYYDRRVYQHYIATGSSLTPMRKRWPARCTTMP
ncbi:MAG: hypothetical protein IJQ49_07750 [Prevotella sp.]|nr:hypothetical protein [Prevotella sp.]